MAPVYSEDHARIRLRVTSESLADVVQRTLHNDCGGS